MQEERLTRVQSRGGWGIRVAAESERRRHRDWREEIIGPLHLRILAALSLAKTTAAVDVPHDAELLKLRDTESGIM